MVTTGVRPNARRLVALSVAVESIDARTRPEARDRARNRLYGLALHRAITENA